MRRLLLGVLVVILPFTSALADVASDIASGQPMATIFDNAVKAGETIESTLDSVISAQSDLGAEALCSAVTLDPENAANLAEFALTSGLAASVVATSAMQCAPEKAQEIFARMQQLGMPEDELLASALQAGQDPTALLEATAAGNPAAPITPVVAAPGQTGLTGTPAPFASNTGGGGGGVASPG